MQIKDHMKVRVLPFSATRAHANQRPPKSARTSI